MTPEEKTRVLTSLERIETTLGFIREHAEEIKPKVNKNTNFRFTSYGLFGFISLSMAIYKFFGGRQ